MDEEAKQEIACGLPKSGNACQWRKIAPLMCERCGWNPEEQARRKPLPLRRGEDGRYHKDISRDETSSQPGEL